MTIPTIGKKSAGSEPVSTETTLRVIAFVLVIVPTAVALNVLLWSLAAMVWRG